jgi:hypothetical protein
VVGQEAGQIEDHDQVRRSRTGPLAEADRSDLELVGQSAGTGGV